jgi:hypothetical protein
MPTLPNCLAAVRFAVASFLCFSHHVGSLYGADNAVAVLNIAGDVDGNAAIKNGIYATLLICAFANDAVNEYGLSYNEQLFGSGDRNLLYVRRGTISGQKGRKNRTIMFGRFGSMEVAKRANVVR